MFGAPTAAGARVPSGTPSGVEGSFFSFSFGGSGAVVVETGGVFFWPNLQE